MMWIKQVFQGLFPGNQLTILFQMIGVFALIILYGMVRAKFYQDRGGSAVFLTKQRFQTLFGKEKNSNDDPN